MAKITPFPRTESPGHTIGSELEIFLAYCRDRRGLSANTVAAYRSDLWTAAAILSVPLDQVTIADIELYLTNQQEKQYTTNRRIVSLRRFFRWAVRQDYCDRNPLDGIEAKQDDEHLPRPIHADADLQVLDGAIARAAQPYQLIFTLLRETGMRADEVLSL